MYMAAEFHPILSYINLMLVAFSLARVEGNKLESLKHFVNSAPVLYVANSNLRAVILALPVILLGLCIQMLPHSIYVHYYIINIQLTMPILMDWAAPGNFIETLKKLR